MTRAMVRGMSRKLFLLIVTLVAAVAPGVASAEIEIRRNGSSWAKVEDDGTIRIDGSSVGKIESGGTIRKDGSSWGSASNCCGDHGSKRTVTAVIVFFGEFFN